MIDVEMKPCPFCGSGIATTIQNAMFSGVELTSWRGYSFVNCGTCGAESYHCATKEEAIAAWNRRA